MGFGLNFDLFGVYLFLKRMICMIQILARKVVEIIPVSGIVSYEIEMFFVDLLIGKLHPNYGLHRLHASIYRMVPFYGSLRCTKYMRTVSKRNCRKIDEIALMKT
jgi:hypothetical protein